MSRADGSTDDSGDRSPDGSAAGASTGGSGGPKSRLHALVNTWPRRIAVGIVALVTVLGALYLAGVIGAPSAGLEDRGDWGEVTEERTEIITTVRVPSRPGRTATYLSQRESPALPVRRVFRHPCRTRGPNRGVETLVSREGRDSRAD